MPCAKCHQCDSAHCTVTVGHCREPVPTPSLLMNCDSALISAQLAQRLSLWRGRFRQGKRQGYSESAACPGLSLIYEMRPRSPDWTDWLARDSCTGGVAARYGEWKQRKMNSGIKIPFPVPTYQHETSVSATVVPSGGQNYRFGEIALIWRTMTCPPPPSRLHYDNSLLYRCYQQHHACERGVVSARAIGPMGRVGKNIFPTSDKFPPAVLFYWGWTQWLNWLENKQ